MRAHTPVYYWAPLVALLVLVFVASSFAGGAFFALTH
jgi:hypothetical protein